MNTILIAGAGQLGSRHLQGVKLSQNELDIWVYDLSIDSLKVAEERYNQVNSPNNKTVHFVTSLDEVPEFIDVAIVASSSKPRYAIVTSILKDHSVKYMVLEKFLFPRLSDYDEIKVLLEEKNVSAFVNCPRRMFESYNLIKSLIDTNKPITYFYEEKDWGLCCNSIHYIDIFMMLTGSNSYYLNLDDIETQIVESKRKGYVEFYGREIVTTSKGDKLILSCPSDYEGEPKISIDNGTTHIEMNESTGDVFINGEKKTTTVQYQSSLSGKVVDSLLETGKCSLTQYAESAEYHKIFLNKVAPFINNITGSDSDSCPIT